MKLISLAALFFAGCSTLEAPGNTSDQSHGGTMLNVNGHVGYRRVQGSGWKGYEDQGVGGVSADFTPRRWPIGFEAAVFGATVSHEDNGKDVDRGATDFSVGLNKTVRFGSSPFRAYVGAGVAAVNAEQERASGGFRLVDDDSSAAWYGRVGAYWRIAKRFNLGVEGRTLQNTELELFGRNADSDHWQVTVFFGWGW